MLPRLWSQEHDHSHESADSLLIQSVQGEEIQVSARRLSWIQGASMGSHRIVRSLDDVLADPMQNMRNQMVTVPSVQVLDRGHLATGSRFSIRGFGWRSSFGVRGVFMQLDGIPLTLPDGQSIDTIIEPDWLASVQVNPSANALLWGNATGGSVDFSNLRLNPDQLFVRFGFGSFGHRKISGGARLETDFGSTQVLVSSQDQNGYRDHAETKLSRWNASHEYRFKDESKVELRWIGENAPLFQNPGSLTAQEMKADRKQARGFFEDNNARKKNIQHLLSARWTKDMSRLQTESRFWGGFRDLTNPLPFAFIELERLVAGARADFSFDLNYLNLVFGSDWGLQHDERKEFNSDAGERGEILQLDQTESVNRIGGLLALEKSWSWGLFSAGARFDAIHFDADDHLQLDGDQSGSRSFNRVSPMLALRLGKEGFSGFFRFSTNFETPTTNELSNNPRLRGGFNPSLDPEEAVNTELGFNWNPRPEIQLSVNFFRTYISNRIISFQVEESPGEDFFQNQGNAIHQGIEFQAQGALGTKLAYTLSYSFLDARFTNQAFEGNRIPGLADHRMGVVVDWNLGWLRFRPEVSYQGSMKTDSENEFETDNFVLVNLSLSSREWTLGSLARVLPFVRFNNVFDRDYVGSIVPNAAGQRFFEPAIGFNFMAGLTLSVQ